MATKPSRSDKVLTRAMAVWIVILLLFPGTGFGAANIRGRIVHAGSTGDFPVPGVQVRVFRQDIGWSAPTFTGSDGMYYLYNIPPGQFQLCVGPQSSPCFTIQVPMQGWTDIAPIRI